MEGGGRLGRSSTRYGTGASATVFTGPVRKWKKRWVPIPPPPSSSHKPPRNLNSGNVSNTLLLFKWTQATDVASDEEPPRRRFRYIPIANLDEQKEEAEENTFKAKFKKSASEDKPDINDLPMYEIQGRGGKVARQDLNEGTFDLSLG